MSPGRRRRFAASYEACDASVARARAEVSSFASRNGATPEDLDRVRLAVSEAVTNAVVHAYPPDHPGLIHLTASAAGGELAVTITDDGCCIAAAAESPGLGLGLSLIENVCVSLTVTARAGGGTQLEMRFQLSHSAATGEGRRDAGEHYRVASLNPMRLAEFLHGRAAEGGT